MTKIRIKYENDRGTLQPEYVDLQGGSNGNHPRLWWIEVKNPTPNIKKWYQKLPSKLAAFEVAAATLELEKILGITDPTNIDDWKSKNVNISVSDPRGFVNWPDPDLGKGW